MTWPKMARHLQRSDRIVIGQNSHSPLRDYAQPLDPSRFDYSAFDKSVAKFLTGHAQRIRKYVQTTTIQIGKDLIAAKLYLSHGQFIRWVEQEAGIPARTAQASMRVAQWSASKGSVVAHLPSTLLFILSASSTPIDFVQNVLQRVEAGEQISPAAVRRELKLRQLRAPDAEALFNDIVGCSEMKASGVTDGSMPGREEALSEAVLILFLKLNHDEFQRVKSIMTYHAMLNDADLSSKILGAFTAVVQS